MGKNRLKIRLDRNRRTMQMWARLGFDRTSGGNCERRKICPRRYRRKRMPANSDPCNPNRVPGDTGNLKSIDRNNPKVVKPMPKGKAREVFSPRVAEGRSARTVKYPVAKIKKKLIQIMLSRVGNGLQFLFAHF